MKEKAATPMAAFCIPSTSIKSTAHPVRIQLFLQPNAWFFEKVLEKGNF